MKGIIFTEFLEMLEERNGAQSVNKIIENSNSSVDGAYTSVGNYDHKELISLLKSASKETGVESKMLLFMYGQYLFLKFVEYYPVFFESIDHPFDFLESVDNHVHVEVRKLYPNAELPQFISKRTENNVLEMLYVSNRRMEDFAHGLIDQCLKHFVKKGQIRMKGVSDDSIQFIIEINE